MKDKKIVIGIDLDEVIRSKWVQFDRYFVEEFGEELAPKDEVIYTMDFFNDYKWRHKKESIRYLKEPEDTPEDINPLDYEVDENGEAIADSALFKPKEVVKMTPEQVYKRFMYEDFCFEIHGSAPMMYKNMDLDVGKFIKRYGDDVEFVIISKENWFSIPPTLFFLSKITSRFKSYRFVDEFLEYWKDVDLIITTNPKVVKEKPEDKKIIILKRPYNADEKGCALGGELFQINDLFENEEFEKIIGFNKENEKKDE